MKEKINNNSELKEVTIFEDFLEYCKQDNPKLAKDIQIWLCDYFDIPNREIPLDDDELKWINENLNKENQEQILGRVFELE